MERTRAHPTAARAFTLVEILFAIAVVGILIGLLVVGLTVGRRVAAGNAGATTLASIKMGASEFNREFGITIPLIKDVELSSAQTGERKFPVFVPSPITGPDAQFLRGEAGAAGAPTTDPNGNAKSGQPDGYWDLRYSYASIPYYLIGVDETPILAGSKVPIDGVPGVGFLRPNEDGTFQVPESAKKPGGTVKRAGQSFGPYLDTSRAGAKVARAGVKGERFEVRDAKDKPIRYYRWMQGDPTSVPKYQVKKPADLNVPKVVGDPEKNPELRGSTSALVWCGPDGLFGDEPKAVIGSALNLPVDTLALELQAREQAMSDNKVEVLGS